MRQVVIVLPTLEIGGTEKRLLNLWIFFRKKGYENIRLILNESLLEECSKTDELREVNRQDTLRVPGPRFRHFASRLIRVLREFPAGTIFHYPLGYLPLIHTARRQKILITFPSSDFSAVSTGGGLGTLAMRLCSFWEAWKIDVLNPVSYHRIRTLPFVSLRKVHLTPGSFVDTGAYSPGLEKKNWLVFLGRFEEHDVKNALPFVRSIPVIYSRLQKKGVPDIRFFVLGRGKRGKEICDLLRGEEYRGIPITSHYEPNPQRILAQSRVFFSLQKVSNYPSRSLLEALACGNLGVVTDVGETRMIAREPFSFFVGPEWKKEDLAECALRILTMDESEFGRRVVAARKFIEEEFSLRKAADYYLRLYEI